MKKKAIILGASGLVGGILLDKLLRDHAFDYILSISRTSLKKKDDKLHELVLDLKEVDFSRVRTDIDVVFCCVGTTAKKTPDQELYKTIDFGIPANFAAFAKENSILVALGSASKNAQLILKKLDLLPYFHSIVDGTHVTHSKPNPEVFLLGAKNLNTPANQCVVFEDAAAGLAAAKAAQMVAVGIGDPIELAAADYIFNSLESIDSNLLQTLAAI